MIRNQDYKNAALAALKGNWAPALVATIIFFLLVAVIATPGAFADPVRNPGFYFGIAGGVTFITFFIGVPMQIGYYNAFKELYVSGDNAISGNMFSLGFSKFFKKIFAYLLVGLIVMVGFFLLVIPGIILAYAYVLVPYLLVDEPDLSIVQTLKRSRTLMKGHKFDVFYLELSFIGWAILAVLTFGIGYLWLMPYLATSLGVFYKDVVAGTAGTSADPMTGIAPDSEPKVSSPESYMPSEDPKTE